LKSSNDGVRVVALEWGSSGDGVGAVALQSKTSDDGIYVVVLQFHWSFAKKFQQWCLDFARSKSFEAFNLP
jgi:hypothetical protein